MIRIIIKSEAQDQEDLRQKSTGPVKNVPLDGTERAKDATHQAALGARLVIGRHM